jgi:hypothetical protein
LDGRVKCKSNWSNLFKVLFPDVNLGSVATTIGQDNVDEFVENSFLALFRAAIFYIARTNVTEIKRKEFGAQLKNSRSLNELVKVIEDVQALRFFGFAVRF